MKANQIKWLRKELLLFKWLKLFLPKLKNFIGSVSIGVDFFMSLFGFIAIIYFVGFNHKTNIFHNFSLFFELLVWIFFISAILQLFIFYKKYLLKKILFNRILFTLILTIFVALNLPYFQKNFFANFQLGLPLHNNKDLFNMLITFLIFIRQFSKKIVQLQHHFVNPAQLFTISFLFLILFGSMLLLLPQSTHQGINLIDAVFTSASAVCVTGLTVVDTYSCFTELGKTFILLLIQIGGIGVMTFTGFFALFFRGNFSFKDQLMLRDILNKGQITGILRFIYYIIFATLIFEGFGAIVIYTSTDASLFTSNIQHWFFAIFHSVSAFCNAGFSNVDQGLYNISFRYNYIIQLVIAILIIFGGLGYNVILNIQQYFIHRIKNLWKKRRLANIERNIYYRMNVNAKLAINATIILLVLGTTLFLFSEYNGTLANLSFGEKLIASFFSSVTPRTAGFNTIDYGQLSHAACLLTIFLMWVGASPGSTGGGIKTTTFSVAILNAISLGKGKEKLEVYHREIDVLSIRRAFSVILLSVLIIMLGSIIIQIFDPQLPFRSVIFESFSALGTVGLTLGITTQLSDGSKIVIILLMFIGRIGAITLMTGFMKKLKNQNYRYCSEQILIN